MTARKRTKLKTVRIDKKLVAEAMTRAASVAASDEVSRQINAARPAPTMDTIYVHFEFPTMNVPEMQLPEPFVLDGTRYRPVWAK